MKTTIRRTASRGALAAMAAVTATLTLAAPATSSPTPAFDQQLLDRTNAQRARHGVPPLVLDPEISRWAQEWAERMATTGDFAHRPNNKYGENLHYAWSSDGASPSGAQVADAWYNQIRDYPYFGREPDMSTFSTWGNFTQVVWKSSRGMGVGLAKARNKTYVVVNYDPPGNYVGQFAANVPAPR
ncbi:CAP family protein [Streptomyces buecherae]|uniref:CAP family protein n=1 Tax=Streptomyces buecherae TaxID=2763006 RepID=UPI0033D22101